MALVSCELAWEEEATNTTTGSERLAWYKAFCSSAFDADKAILTGAHGVNPPAPIVPFDPDPIFDARVVVNTLCKRISGSSWFDVQVTYSTDVPIDQNPLSTLAEVTVDFVEREVPSFFDVNGNPKVNTAGDPLGDPITTVNVVDLIFNVTKNQPVDQYPWLAAYVNSVSSDDVRLKGFTLPAGTLRFIPRTAGKDENTNTFGIGVKNVPFTPITFALAYRAQGWTTIVPNRGFNQLIPTGKAPPAGKSGKQRGTTKAPNFKFTKFPIKIGVPPATPTEPQWLDANGRLIPFPLPSNVVLLEWDDYVKLPYNQLPLK